MRLLLATDAWHPQVNGVVRSVERMAEAAAGLGVEPLMLTPADFPSLPMPGYREIRLSLVTRGRVLSRWERLAPTHVHIATEGPIGHAVRAACLSRGQAFTTIEMSLVRRLVEIILTDLELSFQPLSPVRFGIDRIETNPRFATITRPGNAAILITLKLDMDGRGGGMQILFPYATVEPIRDLLMQSFMGERLGRDQVWESHLATEIWQADVDMEAVLHEVTLPLKRVLNLKVGDTLMFDRKPSDLITVRCGDWALTQGRIGRIDDAIAVQIARPLRQSRTTLQAYEISMQNRNDG